MALSEEQSFSHSTHSVLNSQSEGKGSWSFNRARALPDRGKERCQTKSGGCLKTGFLLSGWLDAEELKFSIKHHFEINITL